MMVNLLNLTSPITVASRIASAIGIIMKNNENQKQRFQKREHIHRKFFKILLLVKISLV